MSLKFMNVIPFLVFLVALTPGPAQAEGKYNLKPGARGKLCMNCHVDFGEKLSRPYVHTPVKGSECSGCHNPHTSDHGKLLSDDPDRICYVCHDSVVPQQARSVHQVVADSQCSSCHDPHSADNENNLLLPGEQLCFSCHEEMAEALGKLEHPHAPVADSCLSCHNPHASAEADALLSSASPELCKKCHETGDKKFAALHVNYPVADADCTTCHNPHGSNRKAILYNEVHSPVAKRMCNQCHEEAGSVNPLKTKKVGFELCRGCHNDTINEAFGKNRLHGPMMARDGCLSCHSPHAAKQDALLKGTTLEVCGQCHADTLQRQERSKTKHEPIMEGECMACHEPHASDHGFLAKQASIIDLCGTCHEWQSHSTHPIGDEFQDKRNPNMTMNCLSCHRSHGTEFEHLIPFATTSSLCVQCHEQYKR